MCIDCPAVNNIAVKYRYPIPRLNDMLDKLQGICLFSKINFKSCCHHIRMKEGDERKTTFKTKYELYEWLIITFRFTNALNTFYEINESCAMCIYRLVCCCSL